MDVLTIHLRVRLITADETTPISRVATPRPSTNGLTSTKVIVDPSKGGAVSPKSSQHFQALNVQTGSWVWDGLVKVLEVDLFSPTWEVRHGAVMALRELLNAQGKFGGTRGRCYLFTWPQKFSLSHF